LIKRKKFHKLAVVSKKLVEKKIITGDTNAQKKSPTQLSRAFAIEGTKSYFIDGGAYLVKIS
jgi:hypothetical protein